MVKAARVPVIAKELAVHEVSGFLSFVTRDSLLDVAVGMILGNAFAKLTESLVQDLVGPLMSTILSHDMDSLTFTVGEGDSAIRVRYGAVLQHGCNFLIQSLVMFLFLRHVANRDV